uniref:Nonstructural polyprotein n=1 Tax=Wenling samurai squirrelfish hepevirus TaxID=2116399 RepID=A0A2P1GMP1_9VIRU|nr:nonstructural polyprotein [Wenling samurai squirrelfish hepevirus]
MAHFLTAATPAILALREQRLAEEYKSATEHAVVVDGPLGPDTIKYLQKQEMERLVLNNPGGASKDPLLCWAMQTLVGDILVTTSVDAALAWEGHVCVGQLSPQGLLSVLRLPPEHELRKASQGKPNSKFCRDPKSCKVKGRRCYVMHPIINTDELITTLDYAVRPSDRSTDGALTHDPEGLIYDGHFHPYRQGALPNTCYLGDWCVTLTEARPVGPYHLGIWLPHPEGTVTIPEVRVPGPDLIELPSLVQAPGYDLQSVTLPGSFVRRCFSYLSALPDDKFSIQHCMSYMRSISAQVVIDGQVIVSEVRLSPGAFLVAACSIYALSARDRFVRSKGVGRLLKKLNKEQNDSLFLAIAQAFGSQPGVRVLNSWAPNKLHNVQAVDYSSVILTGKVSLPSTRVRRLRKRRDKYTFQRTTPVKAVTPFLTEWREKHFGEKNSETLSHYSDGGSTVASEVLYNVKPGNPVGMTREYLSGEPNAAVCKANPYQKTEPTLFICDQPTADLLACEKAPIQHYYHVETAMPGNGSGPVVIGGPSAPPADADRTTQGALPPTPKPPPALTPAPAVARQPSVRRKGSCTVRWTLADIPVNTINISAEEVSKAAAFYGKGEGKFKATADMAAQAMAKVVPGEVKYRLLKGGPGTGKSRRAAQALNPGNTFVITPTKALADQWKSHGFKHCKTMVSALAKPVTAEHLIIDEVGLYLIGYLRHAYMLYGYPHLYLLGDPKQIGFIDFSPTKQCGTIQDMWDTIDYVGAHELTSTERCPADVVARLNLHGYKLKTTSKVEHSIFRGPPPVGLNCQVLTATQAQKALCGGSMTVHEAQGRTWANVHLTCSAACIDLLHSHPNHLNVAISRHTERLFVTEPGDVLSATLGARAQDMITNLEQFGATLPTAVVASDLAPLKETLGEMPRVTPPVSSPVMAAAMVQQVSQPEPEIAAVPRSLKAPKMGTWTASAFPVERTEIKPPAILNKTRVFTATNAYTTAYTMMERYGKISPTIDDPKTVTMQLHRSFLQCLDTPRFPSLCREDVFACFADMCARIQDKPTYAQIMRDLEVVGPHDAARHVVNFFVKTFGKFTTDKAVEIQKAGQGVSAWDKEWTYIIGPWIRAMERRMVEHLRPHILYAGGVDNPTLSLKVATLYDPTVKTIETDFTEFDSSQSVVSLLHEVMLMLQAGVPEEIAELYFQLRKTWILRAGAAGSLMGNYKKHSGEPATLLFNTIYNMSVMIHTTDDGPGHQFWAFKGDDAIMQGRVIPRDKYTCVPRPCQQCGSMCRCTPCDHKLCIVNTSFDERCARLGVKIKVNETLHPEFVSYFITATGLAPDPIRAMGKLLSKPAGDVHHMQEVVNSYLSDAKAIGAANETSMQNITASICSKYKLDVNTARAVYDCYLSMDTWDMKDLQAGVETFMLSHSDLDPNAFERAVALYREV